MGKSSQEKVKVAIKLLQIGKTYREIQSILKEQFGSTMSFSTLQKLNKVNRDVESDNQRIEELERELALFKKLYFDLQKTHDEMLKIGGLNNDSEKKTK